jgi:uncharacterized membrane protein YeaQ/YmgE (transglycosylase-associated protein family)
MIENALVMGFVWGGIAIAITYGCEVKEDWFYNWIKGIVGKVRGGKL